MSMYHAVRKAVLGVAVLVAASVAPAGAQQLVSIKGDSVNMRASPSARGEILWQLGQNYPLKVIGRKGSWFHVVDFENDKGWVARRLTSTTRHYVVKAPRANLRAGPGTRHRIVASASYGEVFRVLDKRSTWVQVKGEDARKGWIARNLLWGW